MLVTRCSRFKIEVEIGTYLGENVISIAKKFSYGIETKLMYHYPLLSRPDLGFIRAPGPGFGNLLFPITRALQAAKIKGETFIPPTMFNVKIGPLLRQERSLRFYNKEIKKRNFTEWMNFLRAYTFRDRVTYYSGQGNLFHDLKESRLLIKNWLLLNTVEKPINHSGKIAVHIRRGDFKKSNNSDFSYQIPTKWYLDVVDRLLSKTDTEVILFTDGKVSDKWSIFGSRIQLSQNKSACSNIMSMSTADILVASRSTFSLWSYFLSKQNTFFPKGLDLSPVISDITNIEYA